MREREGNAMVYAKTKAMKLKESACNNAQHLVESTSHDGFISFNRDTDGANPML